MASEWEDGRRGAGHGQKGRWSSVEEAKKLTIGNEEWWMSEGIGGRTVEVMQHDPTGPQDKHIWLYQYGDMYLGEWKAISRPIEHGFGVYYRKSPWCEGNVYVGNWEIGRPHGQAKEFWLESAPTWIENDFQCSPIKEKVDEKSVGRPFTYKGEFINGPKHDSCATVTLKDGTCRVGPWKGGAPVGDFWNHDDHPLEATAMIPAGVSSQESNAETKTQTRPAKRARGESSETQQDDRKPPAVASQRPNGENAASERVSSDNLVFPDPPLSSMDTNDTDEREARIQKL